MKLKNLKVGTSIFSLDFERPYLREKKPCATNYSRGHLPQTATNCHIAKKLCRFPRLRGGSSSLIRGYSVRFPAPWATDLQDVCNLRQR